MHKSPFYTSLHISDLKEGGTYWFEKEKDLLVSFLVLSSKCEDRYYTVEVEEVESKEKLTFISEHFIQWFATRDDWVFHQVEYWMGKMKKDFDCSMRSIEHLLLSIR